MFGAEAELEFHVQELLGQVIQLIVVQSEIVDFVVVVLLDFQNRESLRVKLKTVTNLGITCLLSKDLQT